MKTMKKAVYIVLLLLLVISCKDKVIDEIKTDNNSKKEIVTNNSIQVATFIGQQVTGVSVADDGRIFVNFPRWREGVARSVAVLDSLNQAFSYPDASWNSWEIGQEVAANKFVGIQSVVVFEQNLYVLDTRNPMFKGVVDAPRVFVFDLKTNALVHTYVFDKASYHKDSYINDLRVDKKKNVVYFTDSGNSGLVILDLKSGKTKRVLDDHKSTEAEVNFLTFEGKKWERTVHSDGIALDTVHNKLYFHALTGYQLYAIDTEVLVTRDEKTIENNVKAIAKTSAPDGMLFDSKGNLYFADLEQHKIMYRKEDGSIQILLEGKDVKWADTFSIYDGYLYYTNSRINEVEGDISDMVFSLNKVLLPVDEE